MARNYLPLLFIILIVAALYRDDFSFTLLYFFAGAYALGAWWTRRALASVRFHREFTDRAFLGEIVKVKLEIRNTGLLPIPWLRIHEGLPVDLSGPQSFQRIATLGGKGQTSFEYAVEARRLLSVPRECLVQV